MKKDNKNKINYPIIFLVILILFGLFNIIQLNTAKTNISDKINSQIENAKPAQISLTIIDINKKDCPKCLDISKVVKLVSDSQKINITNFTNKKYNDKSIQSKIKKLGITKFPALIIEGNINKSNFLINNIKKITTKINEEQYVFTPIEAPYLNNDGNLIGKVDLKVLYNKNCVDCDNINLIIDGINNTPIALNKISKIEINSEQGKKLISKYNITKVPMLLFSNQLKDYNSIISNWDKAGTVEKDGTYILRTINPVYYSINENRSVGKINLTIISNENCKNCFNATQIYPAILAKLNIFKFNINQINSTSKQGVNLINKYNLEKFPTMIISGDTNIYPNLKQVWNQVGTIEDNKYIFKNVELLQSPYYDIKLGEITPTKN